MVVPKVWVGLKAHPGALPVMGGMCVAVNTRFDDNPTVTSLIGV